MISAEQIYFKPGDLVVNIELAHRKTFIIYEVLEVTSNNYIFIVKDGEIKYEKYTSNFRLATKAEIIKKNFENLY
jgi:hypothetical protein